MTTRTLLCLVLMSCLAGAVQAQNARITLDVDRTIGEVDPLLYGNFVEHLGRCIQQSDVPYLDVSATYQEIGEVIINGVTWHRDEAIAADIVAQEGTFAGPFDVYEVNGPDVKAQNDFDQELVRTEQKPQVAAGGEQFTYTFPPHSSTMLKGRIERR